MNRVRNALFRLSAIALLLFMAVVPFSLFGVLAPWVLRENNIAGYTAVLHRWHGAQFGVAWGLLIGGALVALQFRPASRPGLVQFLIAIEVLDVVMTLLFPTGDNFQPPFFFGTLIFLIILVATYPDRRALLRLRSDEPPSPLAIALTAVLTIPLISDMYRNLSWHLAGVGGEHFFWGHWVNAVMADLHLVLAGIVVSLRVVGWRVLSLLTGVALIVLGAAGIASPDQDGTWGVTGGGFAVLAGLGYLALAVIDPYGRARKQPATAI
jgi:hypothetical protein